MAIGARDNVGNANTRSRGDCGEERPRVDGGCDRVTHRQPGEIEKRAPIRAHPRSGARAGRRRQLPGRRAD
jgi:hypothetical protein